MYIYCTVFTPHSFPPWTMLSKNTKAVAYLTDNEFVDESIDMQVPFFVCSTWVKSVTTWRIS